MKRIPLALLAILIFSETNAKVANGAPTSATPPSVDTWTGTTSNLWSDASNWSAGVPTAASDADIPAAPVNQPVITNGTTALVNNLTIHTGATLTINSGGTLNVTAGGVFTNSGTFTNNGTFNIPPIPPIPTITICSQEWMLNNLDADKYRNGDPIPQVTDPTAWAALTTGAWCYYNNNPANGTVYGKLYNWYAVNDPRGLAPTGFHVPSDAEWATLETTCLGGTSVAGGKMKETGTTHWTAPNTGATNSSGFTGLPGGFRDVDGAFIFVGNYGFWWSSTESSPAIAWLRYLDYGVGDIYRFNVLKQAGFSVRCLRD